MIDSPMVENLAVPTKPKEKRGISIIWIVPIVALLIGGWLAFKAIRDKGPTITISFIHAEGLEAGKTKIKYRDVEVGQVETVSLSKDLSHIEVRAKLVKGSERFLTDKTAFWVVRARISGGTVSGLSTLLSGAYIGVEPNHDGKPATTFVGLETPPVVTIDQPGLHCLLKAEALGSLEIGSPVYYRKIQVGQVVGYNFDPKDKSVDIRLFIEAPYDNQVTANTRFWNASGIDVTLDAQGLKVQTQSMVSILSGGIAFDLPKDSPPGTQVKDGAIFRLFPDRASIKEKSYTVRNYWWLLFNQSVRGLNVGAPVEFNGIKVGEVVDLNLEFDAKNDQFTVPVLIAIEPQRIRIVNGTDAKENLGTDSDRLLRELIEQRGLCAQLQSGNLLTGQLMVHLAFSPESSKMNVTYRHDLPVIPTIPGSFEKLQESIAKIVDKLENLPLNQIGNDLHLVLQDARIAINQIGKVSQQLDRDTAPQLRKTLEELQNTLKEFQNTIGNTSPLNYKANKAFEEMTLTLRAFRELVETLEQRPQSIIFGKEGEKNE